MELIEAIQQWYGKKKLILLKRKMVQQYYPGQAGHYKSLIDPQFTHMGIAAFRSPKAPYGGVTAAQALANSGNSEII